MKRSAPLLAGLAVLAAGLASPAQPLTASTTTSVPGSDGCDPLDPRHCLLPFPSNAFTVADPSTPTKRRVQLPAAAMPANASGVRIDPREWNLNDGFSPNAPLLTYVEDLDPAASRLPGWDDIGSSIRPTTNVGLVDLDTGDAVPLWAEADAHAAQDTDRLLVIQPARSLTEGHTYAVGLRNLKRRDGKAVEPSAAFAALRDHTAAKDPALHGRTAEMEAAFAALEAKGMPRAELQLAWTFTVASTSSITARMIAIRDAALAELGDKAPAFTVTAVNQKPEEGIRVQIEGTFTVPNFLDNDGSPGGAFAYPEPRGTSSLPLRNATRPTLQAPFVCNISDATWKSKQPAHLVLYGHGLLGDNHEINAGNVRAMSNEHNAVYCATKWAGMSNDDIPNAVEVLGEWSKFRTVADRLQQGVLNQIVLGRLMTRPGGLAEHHAFQRGGKPLIDTAHLDYDGNSQGAIMGLMLTAVSPDLERSVLGVASMDYALLLPRSVDFDKYEAVFKPAYPNDLERVLILSIAQMLWDRAEGAGYVNHVTRDPLPGSKTTPVLVHVAFGDWQVSELAAYNEARSLQIPVHRPLTAPGRSGEREPAWGIPATDYAKDISQLVVWDSGSEPIPYPNLPPRVSRDPHEDPRADPDVRRQKAAFLFEDKLIDVCDAKPCTADQTG